MDSTRFEIFASEIRSRMRSKTGWKDIRSKLISFEGFQTPNDVTTFINSKELLHWSVFYEEAETTEYFLDLPGVDVNLAFEVRIGSINFSDTCLHIASRIGNVKIAELLLRYNGDIHRYNRFRESPIDCCGNEEMKKFLTEQSKLRIIDTIEKVSTYYTKQETMISSSLKRSVKFGVITDVHYGHIIPGRMNIYKNYRHYNKSEYKVEIAMKTFKKQKVDFVVNLGDVVDFHNLENVRENLERIGRVINHPDHPRCMSVLGNHDKYHLKLYEYLNLLNFKPPNEESQCGNEADSLYYYFELNDCRFIVIDSLDICCCSDLEEKSRKAYEILRTRNPNTNPNSPLYLDKDDDKQKVEEKEYFTKLFGSFDHHNERFVYFTGGVGETQLEWIRKNAFSFDKNNENENETGSKKKSIIKNIFIFSHLGLLPGNPDLCSTKAVVWNYDEVYEIIRDLGVKKYGMNVCVMFGHDHKGGNKDYVKDENGIFHCCMKGMITSDVESSFAICNVFSQNNEVQSHEGDGEDEKDDDDDDDDQIFFSVKRCR